MKVPLTTSVSARTTCGRRALGVLVSVLLLLAVSRSCLGQADPASEPAVLAVAKALPAVVNINTERVVKRTVRDPFEDFYAQFFGYNRVRPREIRQTLQSLGSGFIIDPAGYIITNQHVVERAADLKIHVTTNDGKTYNAHYITGDDKTDLAFIKIDAETAEFLARPNATSPWTIRSIRDWFRLMRQLIPVTAAGR